MEDIEIAHPSLAQSSGYLSALYQHSLQSRLYLDGCYCSVKGIKEELGVDCFWIKYPNEDRMLAVTMACFVSSAAQC